MQLSIDNLRSSTSRLEMAIRAVLIVLVLFQCGFFLVSAMLRVSYPFELDIIEGGILEQVRRLSLSLPLYEQPSLDFTAFVYGPLYTYLNYWIALALGAAPSFVELRLVSTVSVCAASVAIFQLLKASTSSTFYGWLAAGLFLSTYSSSAYSFDQGRVDSLALALVSWGFLSISRARVAQAALFFIAAFLTKQGTLIAAVAMLYPVALLGRRELVRYILTLCSGILVSVIVAISLTDGWYLFYCFHLPFGHDIAPGMYARFWTSDLLRTPVLALLTVIYVSTKIAKRDRSFEFAFYLLLAVSMVLIAWSARLHSGGIANVLSPMHFGLAAVGTLAVSSTSWPLRIGAMVLVSVHFLALILGERLPLPPLSYSARFAYIEKLIRPEREPILLLDHPYLLSKHDKPAHAHSWAIYDVVRGDKNRFGTELADSMRTRLRDGYYEVVITSDQSLAADLLGRYRLVEELPDLNLGDPWPNEDPRFVYRRKESKSPS